MSQESVELGNGWTLEPFAAWSSGFTLRHDGVFVTFIAAHVAAMLRTLAARLADAETATVICDGCGFRYGAEHTVDGAPSATYQCPVCSETALEQRIAQLEAVLWEVENANNEHEMREAIAAYRQKAALAAGSTADAMSLLRQHTAVVEYALQRTEEQLADADAAHARLMKELDKLRALVAWQAGELSEGATARLLDVDRLALRGMRDHAVASAVGLWDYYRAKHPPIAGSTPEGGA